MKKDKSYYWLIPVGIGVFLLIGGTIVIFMWSVFAGVNGILKNVSKDIQGSWLCNDTLNVDINKNTLNTYSNDRSDVINATYKVNHFTTTNGHNEYELVVKTYKVQGNKNETTVNTKIEMDSSNKDEMTMTNPKTGVIIRCKKR